MSRTGPCPDCGRPITLLPSGWWSHDGLSNGCWRLSMDGPTAHPSDFDDWQPPQQDDQIVRFEVTLAAPAEADLPTEDFIEATIDKAGITTKVAEADALINEASKLVKDFHEERGHGSG